jgi:hypothetical protein
VVWDEIFSYEENFVVQNSFFDIDSKKFVFERTMNSKSGKLWSTIDTQNMLASRFLSIHKVTGDALYFSIPNMEEENSWLKEKNKELEATLMPPPILAFPMDMIWPERNFQKTSE